MDKEWIAQSIYESPRIATLSVHYSFVRSMLIGQTMRSPGNEFTYLKTSKTSVLWMVERNSFLKSKILVERIHTQMQSLASFNRRLCHFTLLLQLIPGQKSCHDLHTSVQSSEYCTHTAFISPFTYIIDILFSMTSQVISNVQTEFHWKFRSLLSMARRLQRKTKNISHALLLQCHGN